MTASYELRPLSLGEILDGALILLRRNFGLLFGVVLVCQGIPTLMDVYIDLTGGTSANPGLGLLDRLLTLVAGVFVTGATVRVVSEAYLGRTPELGEAIRFAGDRFGTILGANIMSGFLTVLAMLAFIIPGIIVACGYAVTSPAAALESGSSTEALRHSWELTKGFRWKALGLWAVSVGLIAITYIGAIVVGGVVGKMLGQVDAVLAVLGAAASLLIYPVISCVFTLFYYDLRVRKEGFDIEMLSQQVGGGIA
jgi:hypothetical protein